MRINEILQESGQGIYSIVELEDVVNIIKTECSDAYNGFLRGKCIYRGTSQHGLSVRVNPQNGLRISANGMINYYTVAMSQSAEFKNFPPRNKSLICSTSMEIANNFGQEYWVFPVNGTKIGIVNRPDIWDVPKLKLKTIDLAGYFKEVCLPTINEQLDYERSKNLGDKYAKYLKWLTPKNLEMEVLDTKLFFTETMYNYYTEVWFSNTAYMIAVDSKITKSMLGVSKIR